MNHTLAYNSCLIIFPVLTFTSPPSSSGYASFPAIPLNTRHITIMLTNLSNKKYIIHVYEIVKRKNEIYTNKKQTCYPTKKQLRGCVSIYLSWLNENTSAAQSTEGNHWMNDKWKVLQAKN